MGKPAYIAFAIVLASLVAACGAEDQSSGQSRQPGTYPTATMRPVTPQSDMGPTPQNMPGGGRGNDPPHFKGKP
ncbi:MAG TPA: hypothetical protein VMI75_00090 [Polyangiaceae bacterium]|nr:hypothetical protein [Polyangiaceae bacterium]